MALFHLCTVCALLGRHFLLLEEEGQGQKQEQFVLFESLQTGDCDFAAAVGMLYALRTWT